MLNKQFTLYCMGHKGFVSLEGIIRSFSPKIIKFVVAARDSQVENDYFKEIKVLAEANDITFFERSDNFAEFIGNEPAFAISWRWLINNHPDKKLIIAHDSILPKYRGFAPLVNMLIAGEKEIGVSFLYADTEYDKGDIILIKKTNITYPLKINDAIKAVSYLYQEGLIDIVTKYLSGQKLDSEKQEESLATYSLWRDELDYSLNFAWDSNKIARCVDSLGSPYKGATAILNGKKTKILGALAHVDLNIEDRQAHLGKVLTVEEGCPVIVCGSGLIKITSLVDAETSESLIPFKKFRSRFI